MIDGIKTGYLPLDVERLSAVLGVALNRKTVYAKQNGLIFGFSEEVDKDTGELRYMCGVRGSVHKYANRGIHNADRFRLSDLCRVFTELREVYSINPNITRLYSVEFGVNIKLPYDPSRVLGAIRMYKGKAFAPMGKIGFIYESNLFNLKIYDKGRQCGVPGFDNILRIEVKATSSYLKRKGIYVPTLGDLLNGDLWKQFEAVILEMVNNTLIVEAVPVDTITIKEKELFALFTGDEWQALNRNVLHKKKKQFVELAARIGVSSIKEEIKCLIMAECELLRDMEQESGDKINVFSGTKMQFEVNCIDKPPEVEAIKQATKSTFFHGVQKRCFGDKINIKIKADNVATSTPISTSTVAVHEAPQCIAKLSHIVTLEVKARGRPPNRDPITMPLKRVLTNQNQPNEQRRIYSNRPHNQFRNRTMCGRAIRGARLLFLYNKQHRQRDIPSH